MRSQQVAYCFIVMPYNANIAMSSSIFAEYSANIIIEALFSMMSCLRTSLIFSFLCVFQNKILNPYQTILHSKCSFIKAFFNVFNYARLSYIIIFVCLTNTKNCFYNSISAKGKSISASCPLLNIPFNAIFKYHVL